MPGWRPGPVPLRAANPETQGGGPKPAALFPNERRRAPLLYGVPFQPWRALNLRTVLLIT